MSTSVDQTFIEQYSADTHDVFQRRGSYMRDAVYLKPDIVGRTANFHKIGKGIATTKARHGTITPMNQTHTMPSTSLQDYYAGDWVDLLDEAKTNAQLRKDYARGGAMALGRKMDDQITTSLDGTTQSAVTITVTSKAAILATALAFVEAVYANDVQPDGMLYAVITPRLWMQFMTLDQFQNADYVAADGQEFKMGPKIGLGRWKDWLGIKWKFQTGLPGAGTATAKGFIWHKDAVGYAIGAHARNVAENESVTADITWHGDRAAHFVNHCMSGNSVLVDDTGVIESNHNDTTAIAQS